MKTKLIDAFARAFGMLAFAVVFLWIAHQSFPSNWSALVALYLLCVPLAALYGWLAGAQSRQDAVQSGRRVPGLLLIGIAAAVAIFGYAGFKARIDELFYSGRESTSNNTFNIDRPNASAFASALRVRSAGGLT